MSRNNWFYKLFSFNETFTKKNKTTVLNNIQFIKENNEYTDNETIVAVSTLNNKKYNCGIFIRPTLGSLFDLFNVIYYSNYPNIQNPSSNTFLNIKHIIIDDILNLHYKYPYATFQVASQFNCLEFSRINATPEQGVSCYQYDNTQGPSCAIACGPATVYRNYVINDPEQINNLENLEQFFKNKFNKTYWKVINGYLLSNTENLTDLFLLFKNNEISKKDIKNLIKVGIGMDSEVSFCKRKDLEFLLCSFEEPVLVSQVFCSTVPISYNDEIQSLNLWKPLTMTILETMYEATIMYGIINALKKNYNKHSNKIFLTFLGSSAFGNPKEWIYEAIQKSINNIRKFLEDTNINGIDIIFCHQGSINPLFENIK